MRRILISVMLGLLLSTAACASPREGADATAERLTLLEERVLDLESEVDSLEQQLADANERIQALETWKIKSVNPWCDKAAEWMTKTDEWIVTAAGYLSSVDAALRIGLPLELYRFPWPK